MPCYQSTNLPPGFTTTGRTSYKTEADCNQACKEGACCEDGPVGSPPTCSIKTSCECVGQGKRFINIGTTCENVKCCRSCQWVNCLSPACIPQYVTASYSVTFPGQYLLDVDSYIDAFTVSGTVTMSVVPELISECGRYVFNSSQIQATGQRGISGVAALRGFQRVELRDYDDGAGGVVKKWWGTTSPGTVAGGQSVTLTSSGYGNAFLGGESSGYCYRSGSTNLVCDFFPTHRVPGFFGVINPVPAVTNAQCGSITVLNAYGSGM